MRFGRFSIGCLLLGHDDLIRREPDRMYLECCECGRTTPGWTLTHSRRQAVSDVKDAARRAPEFARAA